MAHAAMDGLRAAGVVGGVMGACHVPHIQNYWPSEGQLGIFIRSACLPLFHTQNPFETLVPTKAQSWLLLIRQLLAASASLPSSAVPS